MDAIPKQDLFLQSCLNSRDRIFKRRKIRDHKSTILRDLHFWAAKLLSQADFLEILIHQCPLKTSILDSVWKNSLLKL